MRLELLALVAIGCGGPVAPGVSTDPIPRASVDPRPLQPVRAWTSLHIGGAVAIEGLRHEGRTGLTFAVDPAAGRVHLLDEVFRHSGATLCLDEALYDQGWDPVWREDCPEGQVALHRGYVDVADAVDVAVDPDGLVAWVVQADGGLWTIELDVLAGPAPGWLRASPVGSVVGPVHSAIVSDGVLVVATDRGVLGSGGGVIPPFDGPGARLLSSEGGLWVAWEGALWLPDGTAVPAEVAAAAGGFGAAWSAGQLWHSDGWTTAMADTPTHMAVDPRTGVVWALAGGQLHRIDRTGTEAVDTRGVGPVLVTETHDVVVASGADLEVFVDETALGDGRPPLHLAHVTFLEKPRTLEHAIHCSPTSDGENLPTYLANAAANSRLVGSLPGVFAVGLTPRFAEALLLCGQVDALQPYQTDDHVGLGVLFHQPTDCADDTCYDDLLDERLGWLSAVGASPTWGSGFAGHADGGHDWVAATGARGVERQLFLGADLDPAIPHDDVRYKESWPVLPGVGPSRFAADGVADLPGTGEPGAESGAVAFYPGYSVRGYAAGDCAGLLVTECLAIGGGTDVFTEDSVEVLALLARHAAARRGDAPASWTWHLPDLNAQDYTVGGVLDGSGVWTGAGQAIHVQELAWDLDATLVGNGIAEWTLPAQLP